MSFTIEKLTDYLFSFAIKHKLFCQSSSVLLSVSGGLDSMVLLFLMNELKKSSRIFGIRVIHFNHGTRPENLSEAKLVKDFCDREGIDLITIELNLSFNANFEMHARELRYHHLLIQKKNKELILLAHHIDDSFEWSLMEQMRSGSLRPSLGMPAKNGVIRRPLMAFSKNQLYHIASKFGVPFLEDPSNHEIYFDRNYIRHIVIPNIVNKYPSYLRNYVYRSNQLARILGKHLAGIDEDKFCLANVSDGIKVLYRRDFGIDLSGIERKLEETIQGLSQRKRGILQEQIKKIVTGSNNGIKGPYLVSGRVRVHSYPGVIILIKEQDLSSFNHYEQKMVDYLKKIKASHIPRVDLNQMTINILETVTTEGEWFFPFFVFCLNNDEGKHIYKDSLKADPLFPKLSSFCHDQGIYFRPLFHFMSFWNKIGKKRKGRFFFAKFSR